MSASKRTLWAFTCIAFLAALPSFASADDNSTVVRVETRPGLCRSSYFGFSFSFASPWTVVLPTVPNQFQTAGGDALVRDGVLKRAVVDADQANTHNLMEITNRLDSSSDYIPSIRIVAEGIHEGAPFRDAEGYIAFTGSMLMKIQSTKYRILDEPRPVLLGGKQFYRAEFAAEMPDFTVMQFYYAQLIRGFAFSIVVSGGDKDQLGRADSVLQGIRFDRSK